MFGSGRSLLGMWDAEKIRMEKISDFAGIRDSTTPDLQPSLPQEGHLRFPLPLEGHSRFPLLWERTIPLPSPSRRGQFLFPLPLGEYLRFPLPLGEGQGEGRSEGAAGPLTPAPSLKGEGEKLPSPPKRWRGREDALSLKGKGERSDLPGSGGEGERKCGRGRRDAMAVEVLMMGRLSAFFHAFDRDQHCEYDT